MSHIDDKTVLFSKQAVLPGLPVWSVPSRGQGIRLAKRLTSDTHTQNNNVCIISYNFILMKAKFSHFTKKYRRFYVVYIKKKLASLW